MKKLLAAVILVLFCSPLVAQRKSVYIHGYTRRDGTYVAPHYRSAPGTKTFSSSPNSYAPSRPSVGTDLRSFDDPPPAPSNPSISTSTRTGNYIVPSRPKVPKSSGIRSHTSSTKTYRTKPHRSAPRILIGHSSGMSSHRATAHVYVPRRTTHQPWHHYDSSRSYRRAQEYLKRSEAAKRRFMQQTGYPHGRLGYIIDHVIPLACGGPDEPSNMQWQTIEEAKRKDAVERRDCS
jgi:hypothetical protein